MANASGLSTGHLLGDTGAFSNTIFTGYPVAAAANSMTPFIESDPVLGDIDAHFSGNFVDEDTILLIARHQGFGTAAIGKLGPTLMFDHTERTGENTIIVDDSTGSPAGIPLSQAMKDALTGAGLPLVAPARGANGKAGDFKTPGATVANIDQQRYFADVAAKVVLPMFRTRNKPFVLVFWSRDPDGTQHNQGDSLLSVTPGINGPTSQAAIKNADDNLTALRQTLDQLGLASSTDIVIAADHGFRVAVYNRTTETMKRFVAEHQDTPGGLVGCETPEALVAALQKPRKIVLLVKAGQAVDAIAEHLAPLLDKGDILIDGGNSYYIDDIRRAKELAPKGIHYVDVGTSGGVWGLERGYCMMIGGDKAVVDRLDPIFGTLAPGGGDVPRTPAREGRDPRVENGYIHAGPVGSGQRHPPDEKGAPRQISGNLARIRSEASFV
jgi:hypothetical protein